jgi:hypothetical protein
MPVPAQVPVRRNIITDLGSPPPQQLETMHSLGKHGHASHCFELAFGSGTPRPAPAAIGMHATTY